MSLVAQGLVVFVQSKTFVPVVRVFENQFVEIAVGVFETLFGNNFGLNN